MSTLYSR